jgi:hypothetical protein
MSGTWRQRLALLARGYLNVATWALAGIGYGLVAGGGLELLAGTSPREVAAAMGPLSLLAPLGALLGYVGLGLLQTTLHLLTLVPLFALIGKLARLGGYRPPPGAVLDENFALTGALVSVFLGTVFGATIGTIGGVGVMLEEMYGEGGPLLYLHWATAIGALGGGICGLVELGRTARGALDERWRRGLGIAFGVSSPSPHSH